ncbi:hypothetical protein C0J52_12535 [Blattella germanica]|nr:hypothetical protein C0J52_12535 [Blattella germanica]
MRMCHHVGSDTDSILFRLIAIVPNCNFSYYSKRATMAEQEESIVYSEKGNPMYVIRVYKFTFYKDLIRDIQRWRCILRSSKAFIKLYEKFEIVERHELHNHDAMDPELLNWQVLSNKLKRKAVEDICERPSKLLHLELTKNHVPDLTKYDVHLIKKNMDGGKKQFLPKVPNNLAEVLSAMRDMVIESNLNEMFLLVNDEIKHIVIFSTEQNLKSLCSANKIFIYGTFKSAPKMFLQIFLMTNTCHLLSLCYQEKPQIIMPML